MSRTVLLPLVLGLLVACGDDVDVARSDARPGVAPAVGEPARNGGDEASGPRVGSDAGGRPRIDTRARLDVTGAPDGVVVEIDGEELAGVVLLPPGKRSIYVFAEGVFVGKRDVTLHAGRATAPELDWALEKLAEHREHMRMHPWHEDQIADPGLAWLVAHRTSTGLWSGSAFADRCPEDARCDGAVSGVSDAEATGLALLGFLAAGETHEEGAHARVVRRACFALVRRQDAAGRLDDDPRAHAVGTLALTELCAVTDTVRFREPAQRALDALLAMRTPGRGWVATGTGAPDAEATAWGCFVIESARAARLTLPDGIGDDLHEDLRVFGDPGATRVTQRAGALLTLAALLLGRAADDPAVVSGLTRVLGRPPRAGEPVDPAFLWAATAVVFRVGGKDAWKRWNAALEDGFVETIAVRDPGGLFAHGACDALGEPAQELGRVRAVAFAYLTSAIYYRYGRVFGVTER